MTKQYTTRLDDEVGEWVNAEAERRDRSRSYIIEECVEQQMRSELQSSVEDDASVDADELLTGLQDLVDEFRSQNQSD